MVFAEPAGQVLGCVACVVQNLNVLQRAAQKRARRNSGVTSRNSGVISRTPAFFSGLTLLKVLNLEGFDWSHEF